MSDSASPWTAQRKSTEGIIVKGYTPSPGLYKKVFDNAEEKDIRSYSSSPGAYKKVLDRKYIVWSSEMDCCLARTLVQQIKNGNRKDGVLTALSYHIAVKTIVQELGVGLAVENVKNRLSTLKKQYGILKQLLASEGFEWDKENKMVIAEESVWAVYLKGHPDARQYREKAFQIYDELCIIFGHEEQALLDSSNTVCKSVDNLESSSTSESQSDDEYENLTWSKDMDIFLGDFLAEVVRKASKPVITFFEETYETLVSALNKKFALELPKEQIKKRLSYWKKLYDILKELLSHPGFKWDVSRMTVMADDSVWTDYIEVHPEASSLRAKVIEHYDQLSLVFDNVNVATNVVEASYVRTSKMKEKVNHMWTSEMDSYLGAILMEQIRLGHKNKLGNKLKPAAYLAATTGMNKRFQLSLTRDNVKNRLRIWKKHYAILMELLSHDNFDWDEATKMVVADQQAWDQYVARIPEARLFRGRVINYNELRAIVGHEDPLGVSVDEDAEEAVHSSNEKGKYIAWSEEMDHCLMELLLEQVLLGNKVENNFKPGVYTLALNAINKKFGLELIKKNIFNRLKTLKKQYGLVKEILSRDGFEWDDRSNMVMAGDKLWNDCIKENPDARHVRAKSFPTFNMLRCIIGNEQACDNRSDNVTNTAIDRPLRDEQACENRSENLVNAVIDLPLQNEQNSANRLKNVVNAAVDLPLRNEQASKYRSENLVNIVIDPFPYREEDHRKHASPVFDGEGIDRDNGIADGAQVQVSPSQETRSHNSSSSQSKPSKKRRHGKIDVMIDLMGTIATNVGRIADALAEKKDDVNLDELLEMVRRLPGFDDDLVIDGIEYLLDDDKRVKLFMKLDDRLRRQWLFKRIRR